MKHVTLHQFSVVIAAMGGPAQTNQFGLQQISVIVAAVSTIAAAVSAIWTYRGAALSHRPFVVGEEYRAFTELDLDSDTPEIGVVGVLLRNEGPGVALEVSYRIRSWTQDITTFWKPSVGSLPPGAERTSSTPFDVPSGITDIELGKAEPPPGSSEPDYVLWHVETEFSDIRGVRYTARPRHAFGSGTKPRRVRSWKLDIWRPQRSDHMSPILWIDFRDWLLGRKWLQA